MFELSIFWKDKLVSRSAFTIDEVRIGRSGDNEVQIDNPDLSRYHASIEHVGTVHVIKDFGSQNGTFVNGEPVNGRRALNDGDRIVLGKYRLVFHAPRGEPGTLDGRDRAERGDPDDTDVALITAEHRERPCPFVASLVATPAGGGAPRLHALV